MSVKKQIPSFCRLHSYNEEIPKEFLHETDENIYFYHNSLDVSHSQQQIVRVSRGSNKKSFTFKLVPFCDIKIQQRYIIQEHVNIYKRDLNSLVDSLLDFLNISDEASKFHYQNPKLRLDLQSQKTISLLIAKTISLNIQINKFVYRSELETTILASFPSKSLN